MKIWSYTFFHQIFALFKTNLHSQVPKFQTPPPPQFELFDLLKLKCRTWLFLLHTSAMTWMKPKRHQKNRCQNLDFWCLQVSLTDQQGAQLRYRCSSNFQTVKSWSSLWSRTDKSTRRANLEVILSLKLIVHSTNKMTKWNFCCLCRLWTSTLWTLALCEQTAYFNLAGGGKSCLAIFVDHTTMK